LVVAAITVVVVVVVVVVAEGEGGGVMKVFVVFVAAGVVLGRLSSPPTTDTNTTSLLLLPLVNLCSSGGFHLLAYSPFYGADAIDVFYGEGTNLYVGEGMAIIINSPSYFDNGECTNYHNCCCYHYHYYYNYYYYYHNYYCYYNFFYQHTSFDTSSSLPFLLPLTTLSTYQPSLQVTMCIAIG